MRDYTEFLTKFQDDTLSAIKTAQETSFSAFAAMREYATKFSPDFTKSVAYENMPSASELIEQGFDFAHKLIDMQKEYVIKAAEYIVETSKKAGQTARATRGSKLHE